MRSVFSAGGKVSNVSSTDYNMAVACSSKYDLLLYKHIYMQLADQKERPYYKKERDGSVEKQQQKHSR